MEVVYERCCGIDVHKNMLMVCIFTGVRKKEIREFILKKAKEKERIKHQTLLQNNKL